MQKKINSADEKTKPKPSHIDIFNDLLTKYSVGPTSLSIKRPVSTSACTNQRPTITGYLGYVICVVKTKNYNQNLCFSRACRTTYFI